ncbi:exo-beta-N-acetylmuramidase NamZ domain-containing protein [Kribbella sp. NPDC058693]|uniref:exo-beta-N-acetylmuramidase NamZ family protein n=1 Tax=Kribbella sp. NPDC058693 TaxID=3346602 RepID=UPI00365A0AC1
MIWGLVVAAMVVRTGAQRLAEDRGLVPDGRLGLITNFTGVLPDLTPTSVALRAAGLPLTALFGPEHGLRGTAQAGASEGEGVDPDTGLPVFDTYLRHGRELDDLFSGVDVLLFDIQDIGTRFYTYVWTMYDCQQAAARLGMPFVVLDRPNPLGGVRVEGPVLQPGFESFVGRAPIPLRHGLTVGELARQLGEATVIPVDGWTPGSWGTGMPWVPPSPNMPTPETALVYPGTGLFEGTNLSEGRGTTRPFETIGAPYVDDRLVPALAACELPGVIFRRTWFEPVFSKYAGQAVSGVQLHVVDRDAFEPVRTALVMLRVLNELYPDNFGMLPSLDRLWGSDSLRKALEAGDDPVDLLPAATTPSGWVRPGVLLYEGTAR